MKLKIALAFATTTALVTGCASVDQNTLVTAKDIEKARKQQQIAAATAAPAAPGTEASAPAAKPTLPSPEQMAAALNAPITGMVPPAAPEPGTMTALVPEDPADAAARAALTQRMPAGQTPVQLAATDPGMSSELVALQTGVPTPMPRPGSAPSAELAYAESAMPQGNVSPFDSFSNYDTSAPVALPTPDSSGEAASSGPVKGRNTYLDGLIKKYAAIYAVPENLVHRVVKRESSYNPKAYHSGNYGLMQIRYNTAKSMGYQGTPDGLLDAETNLKYAVKYLRGAFVVADNSHDHAVKLYARGYYYDAKRKGLLDEVQ